MNRGMRSLQVIAAVVMVVAMAAQSARADTAGNVEMLLRELRQDRPLPKVPYLKRVKSMNAGCPYYQGQYRGIEVAVELSESAKVTSVLLCIPRANRTREILPAVIRVLGRPHHSDTKNSAWSWEWPNYRFASVHYAPSAKVDATWWDTIVSVGYR